MIKVMFLLKKAALENCKTVKIRNDLMKDNPVALS